MKNTNLQSAIAKRIKHLVDKHCKGINVNFARKIKVDPANITRWISGDYMPSVDVVYAIAKSFQVSVPWLLGMSNDIPLPDPVKKIEEHTIPLIEFPRGTRKAEDSLKESDDYIASSDNQLTRITAEIKTTSDQIPLGFPCIAVRARADNHGRGILAGDLLFLNTKWDGHTCVAVVVEPAAQKRRGVTINVGVVISGNPSEFWFVNDNVERKYSDYHPRTFVPGVSINDVVVLPVLVVQRNYTYNAAENIGDDTAEANLPPAHLKEM